MSRFSIAMAAYLLIGVLAWATLSDEKMRYITVAILAMFAVRTLVHRRGSEDAAGQNDE
jgi:hypothetical protein